MCKILSILLLVLTGSQIQQGTKKTWESVAGYPSSRPSHAYTKDRQRISPRQDAYAELHVGNVESEYTSQKWTFAAVSSWCFQSCEV